MKFITVLWAFAILIVSECLDCNKPDHDNMDTKLKKKLFCENYDKDIRPGKSSDQTTVNIRYTIKSFDFQENLRTFAVTSWMTLSWNDSRLTWSSADYPNISTIHLNIAYLWSPDIYLYNSHIATGVGMCQPDIDCLIFSSGKVACVMPCEHNGHCYKGDYTNWPFDRQTCSYTFGSWMKTGEEMNYNTDKLKLISEKVKQNNQWKLLSATAKVNPGKYDVAPNETYPSVVFTFLIERHNAFHISGTIVPALILLICNLTALWMLPQAVERFILSIMTLFSHFLYVEFLYWMLPNCGDSVPSVMLYFRDSQIIATVILIETVVLKTLIFKSKHERPPLLIQSAIAVATNNRIGEFLITPISMKIEDATDLVESAKKLSSDEMIWMSFCKLIDRVAFVVLLITYFFMFITLLPEDYFKADYEAVTSVS